MVSNFVLMCALKFMLALEKLASIIIICNCFFMILSSGNYRCEKLWDAIGFQPKNGLHSISLPNNVREKRLIGKLQQPSHTPPPPPPLQFSLVKLSNQNSDTYIRDSEYNIKVEVGKFNTRYEWSHIYSLVQISL